MTQSDNDAEALLFLRKANALITAAEKTWYDLIPDHPTATANSHGAGARPRPKPGPSTGTRDYDDSGMDWAEIITDILVQTWIKEGAREFLLSVKAQFLKHGRISTKQAEAVKKFYPKH